MPKERRRSERLRSRGRPVRGRPEARTEHGAERGERERRTRERTVVQGTSDLAFSATDPGAGVYEALFSVDGQVVQSTVVDENGGRCRNVGQTADGLAAFLYVKPCLGSVSVDVPFDTTRVGNGAHHLIVSVIDPAGNAAPVLDRQVTVANPPAPGVPGPASERRVTRRR